MPCAVLFRQTELDRFLQEEGGAEVRPFGDVDPAERRRQVERAVPAGDVGRLIAGDVADILPDRLEAAAVGKARQQPVQVRRGIERGDIGMEAVLYGQKSCVAFLGREGLGGHDALVETVVRGFRHRLQTLDAGGFGGIFQFGLHFFPQKLMN